MKRLLIANRGEIACRVARSARRLGVMAIAVYSDADRDARHVREADEAYGLGPAPAAESYLHVGRILEAAARARADAVHPGYGFLSENAAFATACVDAGLIFVGPPAAAIAAMGSKSAAKQAMAAAGVPVAPGYHGEGQGLERLRAEALRVGFPLIIKASAGGGGKGMQVVESEHGLAAAIESAQRLARAAFGDDRLLIERYFPRARHVEVQVLADQHGLVMPLFDRDCSVQRRHQKVIEEAPAPGLSDDLRESMAQAAVSVARAVGYTSAGTVEFLVDGGRFYFMEMNTRLQVEHGVTELITGIDLVEWQLRIAQGEPLPAAFRRLVPRGAAMEARLYAEDPASDYLPSVGRISHLRWPAGEGLRVDGGVDSGDEVSSYYDPMLGKVMAWGETRAQACLRLHAALADTEVAGVTTNRTLLSRILADPEFRSPVDTSFLERRADLARPDPPPDAVDVLMAALWYASRPASREQGPVSLWNDNSGWRLGATACSRWRFGAALVQLMRDADQEWHATLESATYRVRLVSRDAQSLCMEYTLERATPGAATNATTSRGGIERARLIEIGRELQVFRRGGQVSLMPSFTEDALEAPPPAMPGSLRTPLPGTVVAVHVSVGQSVEQGHALVTVEAMKMEHTLTSPHAGVIERVVHAPGERVAAGDHLIEMSQEPV